MTNTMTATTILNQLGGTRFVAMTGAKNFTAIDNGIRFSIGRNASRANRVEITVNGLDLYDIKFIKHTDYSFKILKNGTFKETQASDKIIEECNDYYCDMLQDAFTRVTGLYTHF